MPTILVIDDDPATRTVIELILKRKNFAVRVAPDGRAGLSMFGSARFDAVIIDMFMPGMDGRATAQELRRLDRSIPIIVMSGHAFNGKPDGVAAELGASCALQKPFRADDLFRAIAGCLAGAAPEPGAQAAEGADGKRVA